MIGRIKLSYYLSNFFEKINVFIQIKNLYFYISNDTNSHNISMKPQSSSTALFFSIIAMAAFGFLFFQKQKIEKQEKNQAKSIVLASNTPLTLEEKYDSIFNANPHYISTTFDFPVGKPNAKNYFKAREFGQSNHLGEDWNGIGGGNSDLGDPVYSISEGYISFAEHVCCGWGNIVRVVHRTPQHPELDYVESFYAHLDQIHVQEGQLVERGQQIGTIGTADGKYSAHLHLEMRSFIDMGIGKGYSVDHFGFLVPTKFIKEY